MFRCSSVTCCSQECAPGKFEKLQRPRQLECLKCLEEASARVPAGMQSQVLTVHARTMAKESSDDVAAFIDMISPFAIPAGNGFKLLSPRVVDSCLTSADRGKACVRSVVLDSIVPWLAKGESSVGKVDVLCTEWQAHLEAVRSKGQMKDLVLAELLEALSAITKGLLGLLRSDDPAPYTEAVHQIIDSRGSGARFILKNAIVQNPWWKKLQGAFLTAASAAVSVTPEMNSLTEKLKEQEHQLSSSELEEAVKKALLWRDVLRAGATSSLEKALLLRLQEEASKAKNAGETLLQQEQLEGVHATLSVWLKSPLSQSLQLAGLQDIHDLATSLKKQVQENLDEVQNAAKEEALTEKLEELNFDQGPTCEMLQGAVTVLKGRTAENLSEKQSMKIREIADNLQGFLTTDFSTLTLSDSVPSSLQLLQSISEILKEDSLIECLHVFRSFQPLVEEYKTVQKDYPGIADLFHADIGGRFSSSIAEKLGALQSLKIQEQVSKQLVKTLTKEVAVPVEARMKELAQHSAREMETEVAKAAANVEKICGGCRGGKSWKATVLDDTVAWNSVVVAAKPLIDAEVGAELTAAFKALQKVSCVMSHD